ncbi:uncharacterized protein LOC106465727 [Limulus polyphemus]|uniref:Uncharacterized protein LOC106465727 n=1 Tax=Limulus polyphemus TaxID=6850 RepID=A0ABM1BGA7_LIMPO|nr:uncharacterized protein LOC106465727 [Limulus polyphemus]XP_022249351.1 uncharacterized protein LOC106465727 [Limulus polyphemus]
MYETQRTLNCHSSASGSKRSSMFYELGSEKKRNTKKHLGTILLHRYKERMRHQMINKMISQLCSYVPGNENEQKTKIWKLRRAVSYCCFLEKTVEHLCQEMNFCLDREYKLINCSPDKHILRKDSHLETLRQEESPKAGLDSYKILSKDIDCGTSHY